MKSNGTEQLASALHHRRCLPLATCVANEADERARKLAKMIRNLRRLKAAGHA